MSILDKLKRKKDENVFISLQLNARLQPIHRFDLEDMIEEVLQENKAGEVVGGGCLCMPTGEISSCHIDFEIAGNKVDGFLTFLHQIDEIPKGSVVNVNDKTIEMGCAEGLALYLNGTDLDIAVYRQYDINELIESLDNALGDIVVITSYWEGNDVTAIYFYGEKYSKMENVILPITKEHPLCEKCKIEQIA